MNKITLTLIVFAVLAISTFLNWAWGRGNLTEPRAKLQREIGDRIWSWWIMSCVFLAAWWGGFTSTVALFFLISALAMREYISLIDTKRADHRALFWAFVALTPLQYFLIGIEWYGLYSVFIPVYGFLVVTTRVAVSGDCDHFLERTAKIHWGLMTCVYLLSHAPALLMLEIPGFENRNDELFFSLIVLTELADVLQFCFGKLFGKRKIAPNVSPNKTVEGFVGGVIATAGCGFLLAGFTPFSPPVAALFGALVCVFGFCGGLTMSAVKRDHGCKDFGRMLPGHGGILDRVDSLCFTAPLCFHVVRYFFTV